MEQGTLWRSPANLTMPANPTMTMMMLAVAHISLLRQMLHNDFAGKKTTTTTGNGEQDDDVPPNGTHYDYIIVGGGTCGCILANRLITELPNVNVLMLEAGGPQSIITDMIGNTLYLVGGEFDWNYRVQPQRFAGLAYPEFSVVRGRVMGGTSTVQWGIYNRGNRRDYDNWAQRYGLQDMAWNRVRPFFRRYLNFDGMNRTNPVAVSTETRPDPVLLQFGELMNRIGYPNVDLVAGTDGDQEDPPQLGTAIAPMFYNARTGFKSTTANAYIEQDGRIHLTTGSNRGGRLTIVTRATAQRILFDDRMRTAIGVVFNKNQRHNYHMYARKEILLTAGPINTPQLLMLSGIGPAEHLRSNNITVIHDLPGVGENLHDQVFVPLYYRVDNESLVLPFPRFDTENLYDYYYRASGPLAHHGDGVTYYSTAVNPNGTVWPDTMIVSVVEFFNNLNATVAQYINRTEEWRQYWAPYSPEGYYLAIDPVLARPQSRGTVRLREDNPRGPPLIDPRYLSAANDFEAMLDVTRFAVQTLRANPLPGVREFPPIPGCRSTSSLDDYLRCHIRQLARSYYGFAGTAKMGIASDRMAVVDERFRVRGVQQLRVVDASVVPETPNGHIMAATMMLGEKGAAIIVDDEIQRGRQSNLS